MANKSRTSAEPIQYDAQLMAEDMALRGWTKLDLAKRARVADMTVIRFLRGESQTAPTAKKLANALGHSVRRYIISTREAVA
jgi:transcriptional regulator with XRE-family HTH domain